MEITMERFAELIVAEHNYKKLCKIIKNKADCYDTLDSSELRMLRDMCCNLDGHKEGGEFQCL